MRKIRGDEKEKLLKYVGKEPELNLFVIGDIENFGLESPEEFIRWPVLRKLESMHSSADFLHVCSRVEIK